MDKSALVELTNRYKSDAESVSNTWLINGAERMKAFRPIRRGVKDTVDAIAGGTFGNEFKGSPLKFLLTAITEQKQVFEGAAHPFYWKRELRIPDIYENPANKQKFGAFLSARSRSFSTDRGRGSQGGSRPVPCPDCEGRRDSHGQGGRLRRGVRHGFPGDMAGSRESPSFPACGTPAFMVSWSVSRLTRARRPLADQTFRPSSRLTMLMSLSCILPRRKTGQRSLNWPTSGIPKPFYVPRQ